MDSNHYSRANTCILAGAILIGGCAQKSTNSNQKPQALRPTTASAAQTTAPVNLSLTPIPEPASGNPNRKFWRDANISAFYTMGIAEPAESVLGSPPPRGFSASYDQIWGFRLGQNRIVLAVFDAEISSSLVLVFDAQPKAGTLHLSTENSSLEAWVIRHPVPANYGEQLKIIHDDERQAKLYKRILGESAEGRAKDSRCFLLTGTADLTIDASNSVLDAQLKFASETPLPVFAEWYSTLFEQNRKELDDSLETHKIGKKEFDEQVALLNKFETPKPSAQKCMMDGWIKSGYTRLPLRVMP